MRNRRAGLLVVGAIVLVNVLLLVWGFASHQRDVFAGSISSVLIAIVILVQMVLSRNKRVERAIAIDTPGKVVALGAVFAFLLATIFLFTAAIYGPTAAVLQTCIYLVAGIVAMGFAVYRLRRRKVGP